MADTWAEVTQAQREERRELVLTGPVISKRIEENGLDNTIYRLINLNFLEISKTCLESLSEEVGHLRNLTSLILHNNKVTVIPTTVSQLKKLRFFDISNNKIEQLPEEIGDLHELHTFNVSCNKLSSFPLVENLTNLHVLDISHNELDSLPEDLCTKDLALLNTVNASGNKITSVPEELTVLTSLKHFDLSDNKLQELPLELSMCHKLKEGNFKGNKIKDRRLAKLIDQCPTKAVLDYLGNLLQKEQQKSGKSKGKKGGASRRKRNKSASDDVDDLMQNFIEVLHFPENDGVEVQVMNAVVDVRPYIVCCIVRNLDFGKSLNMFKRFITLQTKLHDGALCDKRQRATIATHDLSSVKGPLVYDARPPAGIQLTPLFKQKETTADNLVSQLRKEADDYRKEKKRSTLSGIHKYLDLLKNKTLYPVLVDSEGTVISFPPITNCEATKISKTSKNILIEVTSSINLDVCKKVMDELLKMILETGVGTPCTGPQDSEQVAGGDEASGGEPTEPLSGVNTNQQLVVQQVKITDQEFNLKVVYPSRTDLASESFQVTREYE